MQIYKLRFRSNDEMMSSLLKVFSKFHVLGWRYVDGFGMLLHIRQKDCKIAPVPIELLSDKAFEIRVVTDGSYPNPYKVDMCKVSESVQNQCVNLYRGEYYV